MAIERFTPEEATKAIFGQGSFEIEQGYDGITGEVFEYCQFEGVAQKFFDALLMSIEADEKGFCFSFEGETFPNPLNALTKRDAVFTRWAYYSWWLKKPRGLVCPEWFRKEAECDGIRVGNLPPPFRIIEKWRLECRIRHETLREIRMHQLDRELSLGNSPQPTPEAPSCQVIIEGLTVADVRRMCERSGALASVLRVVAQWQAIEKENPERMTTDVLLSKLKIAARKDSWGTDKGELAEKSQAEPLRKMILGEWRPGGRPRKDSNN